MPRVPEIEPGHELPELKELYAKEIELYGSVLNTTKVQAHCPPILEVAKALGASIERSGQLPAVLRDLVCLRVAGLIGCPF